MKKILFSSGAVMTLAAIFAFSGCQQLQEQAQNLRKQGESTISGLSQQAEGVKMQIITTKEAIDTKSQQVMNAVDAVNKLTH